MVAALQLLYNALRDLLAGSTHAHHVINKETEQVEGRLAPTCGLHRAHEPIHIRLAQTINRAHQLVLPRLGFDLWTARKLLPRLVDTKLRVCLQSIEIDW